MKHSRTFVHILSMIVGLICMAFSAPILIAKVTAQEDIAQTPILVGSDECQECHRDIARNYESSIHNEASSSQEESIGCESCHGAGSAHIDAADKAGGSINDDEMQLIQDSISNAMNPAICGQCHSQGMMSDGQSPDFNFATGELPEGLLLVSETDSNYWWPSGHAKQPNMQYNEWLNSAHANSPTYLLESLGDLDATCLNCHSADVIANPDISINDTTSGVTCASCHDVHNETALPNLLRTEADALCQSCHSNDDLDTIHHPTSEMMAGTTLIDGIDGVASGHATAPDGPTCISCHMAEQPVSSTGSSHTFIPVMPETADPEQTDVCTTCHTDLTVSYAERFISKQQEDVIDRINRIEALLVENETTPQTIADALDFIKGDGSDGVHNVAYTERLLNMIEIELGLASSSLYLSQSTNPVSNPQDCQECHAEEHQEWSTSIHATASLQEQFRLAYAENGQPGLCLECHASGYDPLQQTYAYEGVVCSNCHTIQGEHPPAPVSVANDSSVCAACHSGGHASQYEEWLASEHNAAGVDCVDCHKAHNNSLILQDVNSTCSDCHASAMEDEVHMGQDLQCTDCHMTPRKEVNDPSMISLTGHDMQIDPGVCADCHGYTHDLTVTQDGDEATQMQTIVELNAEIEDLETTADENLTSGLLGGAIGVLLLLGMIYLVIRLWRL